MNVVAIPCLTDNFAYWLPEIGVVIDPSEAGPVLSTLRGASLEAIWCTHHHHDHVGGVPALAAAFPGLRVYGSGRSPVSGLTHTLVDGDALEGAEVLSVPGHTLDALAFYFPGDPGHVFVGDTLFAMGCGRLFEGTPELMVGSLARLRALPASTNIWYGHDYAKKNHAFTQSILPTGRVPTPPPVAMAVERATNLFLRWDDPAVSGALSEPPGVPTFAALRKRRDVF